MIRTIFALAAVALLTGCSGASSDPQVQDLSSGLSIIVELNPESAIFTFDRREASCTANQAASSGYSMIPAGGSVSGNGNFFHRGDLVASISSGFGNV